jgi:hypothetical protein
VAVPKVPNAHVFIVKKRSALNQREGGRAQVCLRRVAEKKLERRNDYDIPV